MIVSKEAILAQLESEARYMLDWDETPFVACDQPCFALRKPGTLEEYKAACEHWESHGYLSGCSHGS